MVFNHWDGVLSVVLWRWQCMGTSTLMAELDGRRRVIKKPDGSEVVVCGRMKRWQELEDDLQFAPISVHLHPVLVPTSCLKIETVLPNGMLPHCFLPVVVRSSANVDPSVVAVVRSCCCGCRHLCVLPVQ